MNPRPHFTSFTALVAILILPISGLLGQPAPPDQPPGPTEVDLIPLNMVDMGTHEVVELLEQLTDKYAIRAQNVPNVQLNFKMKKDDGLTIEEAILVIESLLNLNGVAITGLGDSEKFFGVLQPQVLMRKSPIS